MSDGNRLLFHLFFILWCRSKNVRTEGLQGGETSVCNL
jgi:hypothetical protein